MAADAGDIEIEIDDLVSNSGLYDELDGENAQVLMDWGEQQILRLAEQYEGDQFMDRCADLRSLVRLINQYVGLRGRLEADRVLAVWSGFAQKARSLGYNVPEGLIQEQLTTPPEPAADLPMILREMGSLR